MEFLNIVGAADRVIEIAETYVGVKETGSNRGDKIDEIEKMFGLLGQPYCAMFVLYCIAKAYPRADIIKTASSQTLYAWADKKKFTYSDPKLLSPGDIVIWRKFKLWQGHVGLVTSALKTVNLSVSGQVEVVSPQFTTIEGNTANSDFGNQREGDGIYKRIRYAKKLDFAVDNFYLRGFISLTSLLQNKPA